MLEWLNLIAEKAPCDVSSMSRSQPTVIHMPVSADPEDRVGPPPMPDEDLAAYAAIEQETRSRGYSEIWVTSSPTEAEQHELGLLEELKLIHVQRRPTSGSYEAVSPNGARNFLPRITGLTAKGSEFQALASDPSRLEAAVRQLSSANALTFANLLSELRRSARSDIAKARSDAARKDQS